MSEGKLCISSHAGTTSRNNNTNLILFIPLHFPFWNINRKNIYDQIIDTDPSVEEEPERKTKKEKEPMFPVRLFCFPVRWSPANVFQSCVFFVGFVEEIEESVYMVMIL
ncbi:hypothetical protein P8452_50487 [Trifolium repens]|nr:hypothetical protein P8452_50487 [Trifolium repens]